MNLRPLLRPLSVLLAGGAGLALALTLFLVVLPFLVRSTLSLLGVAVLPAGGALAALAWQWRTAGSATLRRHWRHLLAAPLLLLSGLGLAALARPAGPPFLGVSWGEASLGGLLGQAILGEPGFQRVLALAALLPPAAALLAPRLVNVAALVLRRGAAAGASWQLPEKTWAAIRRVAAETRIALEARLGTRSASPQAGAEGAASGPPDALPPAAFPAPAAVEQPTSVGEPQGIQSTLLPIVGTEDEEEPPVFASLWERPVVDLLDAPHEAAPPDQTQRARQIEDALASYGVEAKVVQIHVGPAVTQFGVEPGWDRKLREVRERDGSGRFKLDKDGAPKVRVDEVARTRVKVERITSLANNLAMALAAPSVRIEAPVPGKPMVGIEVPNTTPGLVSLRSVIESPGFQRLQARSKLALALGKGVAGEAVVADLAKMPHLLIAGATGSGKSVCINSIVCCILMHADPEEVRFLMVDPKRVELVPYNDIPHLLGPVIVDPDKVVGTLQWVIREMEERYRKFAAVGVRNIDGYNRSPRVAERLPFWVLIIDELADLMMVAPYEVERAVCRLAQLARATGIHLIVATQRPSVDVVTGLIKANFPTRISFAVTSHIDSRTILDGSGAEKLLGRGDMLYMATDAAKPRRVQGTYVGDAEVERLVAFWAHERFAHLRPHQFVEAMEQAAASASGHAEDDEDDLLDRARELAETSDRVSASFLQRRLRIGYNRAARLMDALKEEGYGEHGADGF